MHRGTSRRKSDSMFNQGADCLWLYVTYGWWWHAAPRSDGGCKLCRKIRVYSSPRKLPSWSTIQRRRDSLSVAAEVIRHLSARVSCHCRHTAIFSLPPKTTLANVFVYITLRFRNLLMEFDLSHRCKTMLWILQYCVDKPVWACPSLPGLVRVYCLQALANLICISTLGAVRDSRNHYLI